jgi:SPP1 family predicted phage head-tail adaptor
MKTINAGALVHEVTIQSLTDAVDSSGAPIPDPEPTNLLTAWMSRETERSGEKFIADQLSGSIVTRWRMRYHHAMDPDLVDVPKKRRLLYQGRAYDITAAETMDRKMGIILYTLASSRLAA